ncbi:MAG: TetR family transcriptional regulator [Lachnospiraceae bacterium]|nr:TetR family transcriptional regulator [Lachnospiraceae bacterium]
MAESKSQKTLRAIHESARMEFLEKGFLEASLRNIVKQAGVTTGAFYGYYKSKEELFAGMVEEHARYIMDMYDDAVQAFFRQAAEGNGVHVGETGGESLRWMLEYSYNHADAIKLLIGASNGTKYESFLEELTNAEIDSNHRTMALLYPGTVTRANLPRELEYTLVNGMFKGMFELIMKDVPIDTARLCIAGLTEFYTAGWAHLMEL